MSEQQDALDAGTAALSRAWGQTVVLRDVQAISDEERRNLILRAVATGQGFPDRPIILKATRDKAYDPTSLDVFESGLAKEWVATAFLTERLSGDRHAPVFLASDRARGLIVLEDLGAGLPSLVGPLLNGPAEAAAQALLAYARSLGRLHAATLGCIDGHTETLKQAFPGATVHPPVGGPAWRGNVADKVVALLGGPVPDDEIDAIADRMANPGRWLGLAHRDPCPDNVLFAGTEARLLDFEFAGPGHVLLDASYWRMGFPTCWCAGRVPADQIAAMDDVYRRELGTALPTALGDVFDREMALFLFVRMFASLSWLLEGALKEDDTWGISGNRARLLWHLEAAIAGAEKARVLPDLCAAAARWRADLGTRWPEAVPLALYPAFAA